MERITGPFHYPSRGSSKRSRRSRRAIEVALNDLSQNDSEEPCVFVQRRDTLRAEEGQKQREAERRDQQSTHICVAEDEQSCRGTTADTPISFSRLESASDRFPVYTAHVAAVSRHFPRRHTRASKRDRATDLLTTDESRDKHSQADPQAVFTSAPTRGSGERSHFLHSRAHTSL